ncbi:MAG TPA: hypothetical protein VGC57_01425 [Cellulomonas sp.]
MSAATGTSGQVWVVVAGLLAVIVVVSVGQGLLRLREARRRARAEHVGGTRVHG